MMRFRTSPVGNPRTASCTRSPVRVAAGCRRSRGGSAVARRGGEGAHLLHLGCGAVSRPGEMVEGSEDGGALRRVGVLGDETEDLGVVGVLGEPDHDLRGARAVVRYGSLSTFTLPLREPSVQALHAFGTVRRGAGCCTRWPCCCATRGRPLLSPRPCPHRSTVRAREAGGTRPPPAPADMPGMSFYGGPNNPHNGAPLGGAWDRRAGDGPSTRSLDALARDRAESAAAPERVGPLRRFMRWLGFSR